MASAVQLLKLLDYESVSPEEIQGCGINVTEYFEGHGSINFHYVDYYVQAPYIMFIIVGPFILLTILNVLVFLKVKTANRFRKRNATCGFGETTGGDPSVGNNRTIIVIMIVAFFLICQAGCIAVIISRYSNLCFYLKWESELYSIDIFLLTLNSSANFFIYWVFGNKFRKELKSVCSLKRYSSFSS